MAEVLLAGFDAGQSHTTCRLALSPAGLGAAPVADGGSREATGLAVVAQGEGPGVCHLAAPEGPARFAQALVASLAAARAQLGAEHGDLPLAAAAVGASGIEQGSAVQAEGRQRAAAALALPARRVEVSGDERTALRGAFPQGPGIVVISGTGTIAVGRDGRGGEHRCAGWGWLLDGAGSAMDIGRDGLALGLRMADGRRPEGPLLGALWQALALDPADPTAPQRLKALVVDPVFGPAGFARLAPVVEELAGGGDPDARTILRHSAEALAEMVAGVAAALGLEAPPVCPRGGAIEHLKEFRQAFRTALAAAVPRSRIVAPQGDACDGALAWARELARTA